MKKHIVAAIVVVTLAIPTVAAAGPPAGPPGCFGLDRSAWVATSAETAVPWGQQASARRGDNAMMNHAYMDGGGCGHLSIDWPNA
jgi:hypothetical protein